MGWVVQFTLRSLSTGELRCWTEDPVDSECYSIDEMLSGISEIAKTEVAEGSELIGVNIRLCDSVPEELTN